MVSFINTVQLLTIFTFIKRLFIFQVNVCSIDFQLSLLVETFYLFTLNLLIQANVVSAWKFHSKIVLFSVEFLSFSWVGLIHYFSLYNKQFWYLIRLCPKQNSWEMKINKKMLLKMSQERYQQYFILKEKKKTYFILLIVKFIKLYPYFYIPIPF